MTPSPTDIQERETIARIIDPKAFKALDDATNHWPEDQPNSKYWSDLKFLGQSGVTTALAKADAIILALRSNPQPGSEGLRLFAKDVLRDCLWDGSELDGADIQELALKHGLIELTGFDPDKHSDVHGICLEAGDDYYVETALLAASPTPPTAQPGDVERLREGWLPLALCPTDGVDRALLLPSGEEVFGAFQKKSGLWETKRAVEFDVPVFDEPLRGGFIAKDNQPSRPEPERKQIGTRKSATKLIGRLPEGVYPTHFRPNDTVYGSARAALTPSESQEA